MKHLLARWELDELLRAVIERARLSTGENSRNETYKSDRCCVGIPKVSRSRQQRSDLDEIAGVGACQA